ncbi:NADPH-dependent FMN reductase [Allostreptomyces psammosilenae]|uniref:FMN reductase n=1 Tax=Allostreptomyces psammosilenae TaxID=1892865 RepID=A0A853A1E5_9ACTN|nr:NAD(P)H-dependent oxidoreductase [Allostreptomyces psammosilenae]NYI04342.1 FMN reductase [Allostreptomyces psammosilenae]
MSTPAIVVLSGNPRPASRTLSAALSLAAAVRSAALPAPAEGDEVATVDLAELADGLLTGSSERLEAALATVRSARVLVVATPVYKAAYTGLLKSFLDRLPTDGLAGVVAVPVTVSASAGHRFVADVHLRPVLLELGAVLPTASLSLTEADLADLGAVLDGWVERSGPVLGALLAGPAPRGTIRPATAATSA